MVTCIDETDTENPGQWVSAEAEYDIVFLCYSQDGVFIGHLLSLGAPCFLVRSGKWKNILAYFQRFEFGDYDYYWFPDPDLIMGVGQVNGFFRHINERRFDLCQPSLTRDSFGHWKFLKQVPGGTERKVPLVEVMCPCFSRGALERLLWTFDLSYSGYGLDLLWAEYVQGYVIDLFAVKHPRAANFHARAKEKGFPDPDEELREIRKLIDKINSR